LVSAAFVAKLVLQGSPLFALFVFIVVNILELVRHAPCIFESRSTPLFPTAVMLCSEKRVAAWCLAQAADERQNAIPHCLGSCAAFQTSLGPIPTYCVF
jgi:hypothetical protein